MSKAILILNAFLSAATLWSQAEAPIKGAFGRCCRKARPARGNSAAARTQSLHRPVCVPNLRFGARHSG